MTLYCRSWQYIKIHTHYRPSKSEALANHTIQASCPGSAGPDKFGLYVLDFLPLSAQHCTTFEIYRTERHSTTVSFLAATEVCPPLRQSAYLHLSSFDQDHELHESYFEKLTLCSKSNTSSRRFLKGSCGCCRWSRLPRE